MVYTMTKPCTTTPCREYRRPETRTRETFCAAHSDKSLAYKEQKKGLEQLVNTAVYTQSQSPSLQSATAREEEIRALLFTWENSADIPEPSWVTDAIKSCMSSSPGRHKQASDNWANFTNRDLRPNEAGNMVQCEARVPAVENL